MRLGSIVKVVFEDHCEDGDQPLMCTVYGVLTGRARHYIIVSSWTVASDEATARVNNKRWIIIKSCIKSMVRLEVAK